jgi:hypothetical protein
MPPISAAKTAKSDSLDAIFDSLLDLLSRYSPPLESSGGKVRAKRDFHLTIPKAASVPGSYGGKPVALDLASIILQKGYVGFYFMPVYIQPTLKKNISPSLLATLKGKTCFHIKKLDSDLLRDIDAALREGTKLYKSRGWL